MGTLRVFHAANISVRYVAVLITMLRLPFLTKHEIDNFLIKKWKCVRKLKGVTMFKPKYLPETN